MDVPSTAAGTVAEVLVKRGDKVSKGTPLMRARGRPRLPRRAPGRAPARGSRAGAAAPRRLPATPAARQPRRRSRGDTVRMPRRDLAAPPSEPQADRAARSCWCSARVPVATPPRSAPRTWA